MEAPRSHPHPTHNTTFIMNDAKKSTSRDNGASAVVSHCGEFQWDTHAPTCRSRCCLRAVASLRQCISDGDSNHGISAVDLCTVGPKQACGCASLPTTKLPANCCVNSLHLPSSQSQSGVPSKTMATRMTPSQSFRFKGCALPPMIKRRGAASRLGSSDELTEKPQIS